MREACRGLFVGVALVVAAPGTASAKQAGYAFLQCQLTGPDAAAAPLIFRIGNGQWDRFDDGQYSPFGQVACGAERATVYGSSRRLCTFSDREFRTTIGMSGSVAGLIEASINRFTGQYIWRTRLAGGQTSSEAAQCRPVAEPQGAQRQF